MKRTSVTCIAVLSFASRNYRSCLTHSTSAPTRIGTPIAGTTATTSIVTTTAARGKSGATTASTSCSAFSQLDEEM